MDYTSNHRLSIILSNPDFKLLETIKILNTPPQQRTQTALKILQAYADSINLMRGLLAEQEEQAFRECNQFLKYQFVPAGCFVFVSGEKGEYFYAILDGEVSVSVLNERGCPEEVCRLSKGGSFGELALLKDQPRSANIQCTKDTHFATLHKNDYLRILGHLSSKKLEDLVSFFSSLPTFSAWSKKNLIKLTYYFKNIKFKRNQTIFSEGDPADSVFIVKKGEVELLKEIKVERSSLKKFGHDGRPLPVLKPGSYSTQAKISLASVGEIIGDYDIINDLKRTMTCKCYSSVVELLEISKIEFKKRIRTEESLNQLSERKKAKDSHMTNTISFIKAIKQPKAMLDTSNQEKGKQILTEYKSLNPWSSARNLFEKRQKNKISLVSSHTEFIKKAMKKMSGLRSLPLSPKLLQSRLNSTDGVISPNRFKRYLYQKNITLKSLPS
jgi:CRP-like cAMP-binding protein